MEVVAGRHSVVYQALGHLYLRGTARRRAAAPHAARRTTKCYPSFSRDGGDRLHDVGRRPGAAWVIGADGRRPRRDRTPGHYVGPAFTPDGTSIVYRATGGTPSREITCQPSPASSSCPRRAARRSGRRRRRASRTSATTGTRFFLRDRRDDRRVLRSVDLDGGDESSTSQSENATADRASPDGKWVAFVEGSTPT